MVLRKWVKLTFQIEKNLEDLIVWKLTELKIVSFAFYLAKNKKDVLNVEIWFLDSKCSNHFKVRFEKIFKKLLEGNHHKQPQFYWEIINEDWLDGWKKFWRPEQIGNNFLVLPSWMDQPKGLEDKKVIKIDPGAAFGTGSHPTTFLCLKEMENIQIQNNKVLDIGCGSGILTIAAKILGGKQLYAIDDDYLAINSTKENIKLNFNEYLDINLYESSFQEFFLNKSGKDFDLIVCNILADVISLIIPGISKLLKINGNLILSGILSSQQRDILKILNTNNLLVDNISSEKDWICIKSTKK